MRWLRVHKIGEYAYFNHRAHVGAGVGCVSCHGHVEEMEVVHQVEPLSHGLVPRLPPRSDAEPAAALGDHEHDVEAGPGPRSAGAPDRLVAPRPSADRLLGVPPVSAEHWRSLGELEESPESRAFREREFPEGASEAPEGVSRRTVLTLLGASAGAAGLVACRRPEEHIVPYVERARADHARRAAALRDHDAERDERLRPRGREPRGPAHQDRGQRAAPGEPRRVERSRAGRRARPLRPGPLAAGAEARRAPRRGTTSSLAWKERAKRARRGRRRHARDRRDALGLADARAPARRAPEGLPEGARRGIRARVGGERARRRRARRRPRRCCPSTTSTRRRRSSRSTPTCCTPTRR